MRDEMMHPNYARAQYQYLLVTIHHKNFTSRSFHKKVRPFLVVASTAGSPVLSEVFQGR